MDEQHVQARSGSVAPATTTGPEPGDDTTDLTVELDRSAPEPQADLRDPAVRIEVERSLTSVPGVLGARLIPATGDTIDELHVLTVVDRSPSRTARDVRTVLMARFGISADRRAISVVPLEERTNGSDRAAAGRAVIERVAIGPDHGGTVAEVTLRDQEGLHAATSTIDEQHAEPFHAVAEATLGAIAELVSGQTDLQLEGVELVELAGHRLAAVVLQAQTARSETLLSGSALVRGTVEDAVARAVMDAINRAMAVWPS